MFLLYASGFTRAFQLITLSSPSVVLMIGSLSFGCRPSCLAHGVDLLVVEFHDLAVLQSLGGQVTAIG